MNALQRAQFLLDNVGYKPGVRFGVQPSVIGDEADIFVLVPVDDVYHPGRPLLYGQSQTVPKILLQDGMQTEFYRWLFKTVVIEAEAHEAAEHFTVFGHRIFDPHKEPA